MHNNLNTISIHHIKHLYKRNFETLLPYNTKIEYLDSATKYRVDIIKFTLKNVQGQQWVDTVALLTPQVRRDNPRWPPR